MLTLEEVQEKIEKLDGWSFEINSIIKDLSFSDEEKAVEFTKKVAEIAEKTGIHPAIYLDSNNVRISISSCNAEGLTEKDFDMAEEIDKIST